MKVGDKIICKKSKKFDYNRILRKNYYRISYISNNYIYIYDQGGIIFDTYNKTEMYFYDYFYSEKEIRKQKLEKICLNQEIK